MTHGSLIPVWFEFRYRLIFGLVEPYFYAERKP